MIEKFDPFDKSSQEPAFSREGRIMGSKFSELKSSLISIENNLPRGETSSEDSDSVREQPQDDIFLRTISNKINKKLKQGSVLRHPLAGHFNKSKLHDKLEGFDTKVSILEKYEKSEPKEEKPHEEEDQEKQKEDVEKSLNASKSLNNSKDTQSDHQTTKLIYKDINTRKAPPVGQYNPKFNYVKSRTGRNTQVWKSDKFKDIAIQRKVRLFKEKPV